MADFVAKLGKTWLGYRIWRATRTGPLSPAVRALTNGLRSAEHGLRRRLPENRRHDAAQRATLAQFEAESRTRKT